MRGLLAPIAGASLLAQAILAPAIARTNIVFLNPGKDGEPFWSSVTAAMKAAAAQLDMDVEVIYGERDRNLLKRRGLEIVERPERPHVFVIVNEESAATPVIEAADKAGIRTFLLSNAFTGKAASHYGAPRTTLRNWIGSLVPDMHAAGARMATTLIDHAERHGLRSGDGKLHILALGGDETSPNSIDRTAGMTAVVANRPDVVLDRLLHANWNSSEAELAAGRYLKWAKNAGIRPAGVWAANDPMAFGAISALRTHGLEPGRDVFVVGLNWSTEALKRVRAGEMILTDGGHFLGGAWAMVLLRDYIDGCDFAAGNATQTFPLASIDRNNVDRIEPIIADRTFANVRFSAFRAAGSRACGTYDFSLPALFRAVDANQH